MDRKVRILWMIFVGVMVAGLVSASNMGFKLSYQLQTNAAGKNINWVSLPYFNSFATAQDVLNDINNDCGAGNATSLIRFDTVNNQTITHTNGSVSNNFTISAGEAYGVNVSSGSTCTWIIVGSHNNSFDPGGISSILLKKNAAGKNINWLSVPYHTTLSTAEDLCNEINNQNGATVVTSVIKFDTTNNQTITHTCGSVSNNFSLDPGLGVAVNIDPNALNPIWQPSHY